MVYVDFEKSEIGLGVASDDPSRTRCSLLETHRHLFSVLDNMVLGDHVTVGIDNETRARRCSPREFVSIVIAPSRLRISRLPREYRGGTETAALALIDEKVRANTEAVLDKVRRTGALPRFAALSLAKRVRRAMRTRRWDGGMP